LSNSLSTGFGKFVGTLVLSLALLTKIAAPLLSILHISNQLQMAKIAGMQNNMVQGGMTGGGAGGHGLGYGEAAIAGTMGAGSSWARRLREKKSLPSKKTSSNPFAAGLNAYKKEADSEGGHYGMSQGGQWYTTMLNEESGKTQIASSRFENAMAKIPKGLKDATPSIVAFGSLMAGIAGIDFAKKMKNKTAGAGVTVASYIGAGAGLGWQVGKGWGALAGASVGLGLGAGEVYNSKKQKSTDIYKDTKYNQYQQIIDSYQEMAKPLIAQQIYQPQQRKGEIMSGGAAYGASMAAPFGTFDNTREELRVQEDLVQALNKLEKRISATQEVQKKYKVE
jgi:hypothetical protein